MVIVWFFQIMLNHKQNLNDSKKLWKAVTADMNPLIVRAVTI